MGDLTNSGSNLEAAMRGVFQGIGFGLSFSVITLACGWMLMKIWCGSCVVELDRNATQANSNNSITCDGVEIRNREEISIFKKAFTEDIRHIADVLSDTNERVQSLSDDVAALKANKQ